jgi:LDH2 family malate/lactate/ureidoglycolate dehydrogenase
MAIDIAAFGDVAGFKRRVDKVVREMRGAERMPGVERIWVPGEQSNAKRVAYARDGIPLAPQLVETLDQVATELGIARLAR